MTATMLRLFGPIANASVNQKEVLKVQVTASDPDGDVLIILGIQTSRSVQLSSRQPGNLPGRRHIIRLEIIGYLPCI